MADPERITFDHQHVAGADFSRRTFGKFTTIGSTFTDCRFDRVRITDASLGAGAELTELVGCSFDGASLRALGGFNRFVNCTFRNLTLTRIVPDYIEYIDCTFTGKIRGLRMWGAPPDGPGRYMSLATSLANLGKPEPSGLEQLMVGDRNEIHGNDFTQAELINSEFRFGVDLAAQKLPTGDDYLYVPDPDTIQRAMTALSDNASDESRRARDYLEIKIDRGYGQQQWLIRPADHEKPHQIAAIEALRRARV
jgi:hypothetical protein